MTRREIVLKIRLNSDEFQRIEARAGGLPIAPWLRDLALGEAPAVPPRRRRAAAVSPQQAEQIRATIFAGNCLRDLADHLREHGDPGRAVSAELGQIAGLLRVAMGGGAAC